MQILENESLSKYTTFKIGGKCKKLYIPESTDELCDLYKSAPHAFEFCIGGGSNLLIDDKGIFPEVINLSEFNKQLIQLEDNSFYIGASVRLQKAISEINESGYGGIEYLFSVPGLIGGAIYMNAGRGEGHSQSISDYIISVDVLIEGQINSYSKEDCNFGYRTSVFQNMNGCIIIGARFLFNPISKDEAKRLRSQRIELCRKKQDNSHYNFGTLFSKANKGIMEFVRFMSQKKSGVYYSRKTRNWLLNDGTGTFDETIKEIDRVKKIHRILRKKCVIEVRMWTLK